MITKLTNKEKMIANIIFILEYKTNKKQQDKLIGRGYLFESKDYTNRVRVNMKIFNGKGNKELNEMYMDILREFASDWIEYDNSTQDITIDNDGVAWVRKEDE